MSFSIMVYPRRLVKVPSAVQSNSLHLLAPDSQSAPSLPPFPWAIMNLFSVPVSLLLFHR